MSGNHVQKYLTVKTALKDSAARRSCHFAAKSILSMPAVQAGSLPQSSSEPTQSG